METNHEIKNEEDEISSFLYELKAENPYQVPDNYFANTEEEIMMKIRKEPQGRSFSLRPYLKTAMGMAATLIVGIGIYFFLAPKSMNTMTATELQSALKTIPEEELNIYVMSNANSMNNELLAQTLDLQKNIYKIDMNSSDSTTIEEYINEVDDAFILEQN